MAWLNASSRPDHPPGKMDCHGLTDRGQLRDINEDQFLVADLRKSLQIHQTSLSVDDETCLFGSTHGQLLLVADGLGGHSAGERASSLAVDCLAHFAVNAMQWCLRLDEANDEQVLADWKEALQQCDARVHAESESRPDRHGMGTTLTLAYVAWPRVYVIHAGDSRCYLFRDSRLEQITTDHTLAQKMVEAGMISAEQASHSRYSHVLWNAIGGSAEALSPEAHGCQLRLGDVLLLCTDGLTNEVDDASIASILGGPATAAEMCQRLVAAANRAGGRDNITALIARFLAPGEAAALETQHAALPVSAAGDREVDLAAAGSLTG